MKRWFLLIMAVILLTGCSANKYVLDKIDGYDNSFAAIGGKIEQVDANFEIIQKHFVTKEILQKYKPECPDCICNYTVEEVIRMEEKVKEEAPENEAPETATNEEAQAAVNSGEAEIVEETPAEEVKADEVQTDEAPAETPEATPEETPEAPTESEETPVEEETPAEEAPAECEAPAQEQASADAPPAGRVGA